MLRSLLAIVQTTTHGGSHYIKHLQRLQCCREREWCVVHFCTVPGYAESRPHSPPDRPSVWLEYACSFQTAFNCFKRAALRSSSDPVLPIFGLSCDRPPVGGYYAENLGAFAWPLIVARLQRTLLLPNSSFETSFEAHHLMLDAKVRKWSANLAMNCFR